MMREPNATPDGAASCAEPPPPRNRPVPATALPGAAFRTPRVIRFSDCDPAGIVYTARFVDLMNGVIEDFFFEALGVDYHRLIGQERIGLGYAKMDCDFFMPGQMGDRLVFSVLVGRIGGASAEFHLHAHRNDDEMLRARMVMVTTSLDIHRSIRLPSNLRNALVAYQDRCR